MGSPTPLAVSIPDAARLLGGVSRQLVWRMVNNGELPVVSIHRRRLIPLNAIQEYVRTHTDATDPSSHSGPAA